MYKYNKNKKAWENFFDTIEIEIDRILIENGYASPYELFQFNKESVIQKIPIKLSKNGEGNIFDYREVFQFLIQQL